MKQVLHIIGGMNRAGAETMIMNIYRVIDKSQFQFDFLVYKKEKQDYEDEINQLGGRVIHMTFNGGIFGGIKSIFDIREIIKKYGPYNAIHAATLHNSAYALMGALGLKNCRKIVHSHSTANTLSPSVAKRVYNKVTSWMIRHLADEYIACGQEAGEYLFGKQLFLHKGIILNNSVDVDRFYDVLPQDVDNLRKEFGILKNSLVVGSVARLTEVKNHNRMLSIASEMKRRNINFKMLFVGRGELEDSLKNDVSMRDLGNNVIFAGIRGDIPELMHLFDVFLMPSFFEGNPVTLVEAQASGLNSVVSDNITEKIDMGLGLIHRIPLGATDGEWVDAITGCCRSKLDKHSISKSLKKRGFDLRANTQLLSDIYSKNS